MVGKHIASCGHELTFYFQGVAVEYEDYDREGNECVVYATYCRECASDLVMDDRFIGARVAEGKSEGQK